MATHVGGRRAAGTGPFGEDIAAIHASIAPLADGRVADYIPELAKADPDWFGLAVATADGAVHRAGDWDQPFTIQSISKPFVYGLALEDRGRDEVLRRVGVEPTGDAFNSIEIDEASRRPYNPMVNAGAIVTAGMVPGDTPEARLDRVLGFLSAFAGRDLEIDEAVFASEHDTGDRNRAIAYFMRAHGMLDDVEAVLDLYFRQCSVLVTGRDLAVMAATLANGGVNPLTGVRALSAEHVQAVLSVMATCGMYDFAGEWLYTVGLPAKSGVAGGVIAVLPGQLGIGVFSPPLDARGNSVRGIAACQELSRRFHLHEYRPGLLSTNAIRRRYTAQAVRGRRTRRPEESRALDREGHRIAVYELRGELAFGPTERLVRTVLGELDGVEHLVLDFRRTTGVDDVSAALIERMAADASARGVRVIAAQVGPGVLDLELAADADEALQRCEEDVLADVLGPRDAEVVALADQPLLEGIPPAGVAALERRSGVLDLVPGEVLCREGDEADAVFLIGGGTVRVEVGGDDGTPPRRLLTMGPGTAFGEVALLDGGTRSASAVAETPAHVHRVGFDAIAAADREHPGLRAALYRNLGQMLARRLRRANDHVRALEL